MVLAVGLVLMTILLVLGLLAAWRGFVEGVPIVYLWGISAAFCSGLILLRFWILS